MTPNTPSLFPLTNLYCNVRREQEWNPPVYGAGTKDQQDAKLPPDTREGLQWHGGPGRLRQEEAGVRSQGRYCQSYALS